VNSNDQSNQTDLLRLVQQQQFTLDALQSQVEQQSCTLAALWTVMKSSPGGAELVLKIQTEAHQLYQTMKLEELYAL